MKVFYIDYNIQLIFFITVKAFLAIKVFIVSTQNYNKLKLIN